MRLYMSSNHIKVSECTTSLKTKQGTAFLIHLNFIYRSNNCTLFFIIKTSICDPLQRVSIIHLPMICWGKAFCANSDERDFPGQSFRYRTFNKNIDPILSLLQCINHPGPITSIALRVVCQ